jgi:SAM-dependent methyltransferase
VKVGKAWLFDREWTQEFTRVRQLFMGEFLRDVRKQYPLKSAVDLGCGVGYFAKYLYDSGFDVVAMDGRAENVAEGKRRYPEINFLCRNAEDPTLPDVGVFDFVSCVGLLYHLENPFCAIRNLYRLTGQVLLIESMCAPGTEPSLQLVDEGQDEDQGLNYIAFYPTEACLVKMLYRAGFPHVYRFENLPSHELFHAGLRRRKQRTMLAASKQKLEVAGAKLAPKIWGSYEILSSRRERFWNLFGRGAGLLGRLWKRAALRPGGMRKG